MTIEVSVQDLRAKTRVIMGNVIAVDNLPDRDHDRRLRLSLDTGYAVTLYLTRGEALKLMETFPGGAVFIPPNPSQVERYNGAE